MAGRNFSIEDVSFQYFKGFIKYQSLNPGGRHLFLLGPNGYGKSSVVEAIRWGLFGFVGREGVANREVAGDCRVTLAFRRDGQRYTLGRVLDPGGGSLPTLRDEKGAPLNLTDVLPLLQPVQAGEAANLIYSGQNSGARLQPGDIEPFEGAIYRQLGLEDIRATVTGLGRFKSGKLAASIDALGKELDKKEKETREARVWRDEQVRGILQNPPWGAGSVPAVHETEQKLKSVIADIRVVLPDVGDEPNASDLQSLLQATRLMVKVVESADTDKLRAAASATEVRLKSARELLERVRTGAAAENKLKEERDRIQVDLASILAGETVEALKATLNAAVEKIERAERQELLMRTALPMFQTANPLTECPVCAGIVDSQVVCDRLTEATAGVSTSLGQFNSRRAALAERLRSAEKRLDEIHAMEAENSKQELSTRQIETDAAFLGVRAPRERLDPEMTIEIERLEREGSAQKTAVQSSFAKVQEWNTSLQQLQDEIRYQNLQRVSRALRDKEQRLGVVRERYESLVDFGEACERIQKALSEALREGVRANLPILSEAFAKIFVALAQHPLYKYILLSDQAWPKLELQVAAQNSAGHGRKPNEVLNGQALNVLRVVPYFVLSGASDAQIDVHLVMLDDPTQAFDDVHVELFIQGLADLGNRVQLIVATHQDAAFIKAIPHHFDAGTYTLVRFNGYSPVHGPMFTVETPGG
jgi:DNA repair exonuclease SbcCD ATPase subunit